jgi:IMP dehydrogenase
MSNKVLREGLTYDDVLVVPAYSEVLPHMVSTATKFTKNITLNVPVVSAAMDTVTESKMAIAIAQEGGIGVLHKNMSIESQAFEVRKVKRSESGMILDPITLGLNANVGDAFLMMRENKIGVTSTWVKVNQLVSEPHVSCAPLVVTKSGTKNHTPKPTLSPP